jgi:hypothetical protein
MGTITKPGPVKLVIGLLGRDVEAISTAKSLLIKKFGIMETELPPLPFSWTNYYADELGQAPLRAFLTFEKLINREQIASIKTFTNRIEIKLSQNGARTANIDPGYMTLGQFFLVSTKDQRQRVYLNNGIFAEVSLFFKDGKWHSFPWTYRDYRSDKYLRFFLEVRSKLAYQLRHGRPYSERKSPKGQTP